MTTPESRSPLSEHEQQVLADAIALNTRIAAISTAVVGGVAVWLATAVLLWRGGYDIGKNLAILSTFFPGYSVTWSGAWIGLLWGAIFGAISGWIMYATYASSLQPRIERQLATQRGTESLRAPTFVISGNALGIGLGTTVALLQFAMTNWLVLRGTADQSYNAALLSAFLPGYSVSFIGSLVGLIEVFIFTYLCAALVAFLYNRMARRRRAIDR
jgi:hypothetical protein